MLNRYAFLLAFLAAFAPRTSTASHIMGSELTYHWLGGLDYEITLVIVRDCYGIDVADPSEIVIHSTSCSIDTTMLIPVVDTVEVANGCSSWINTCNGGTYPGAQLYFYRDTVTLSGNCADWTFTWTSCCRNAAITNLDTPGSLDFYIGASLDNFNFPGNSSPIFQELAGAYVCMNSPFCLPNATYDTDGDSLVYSMVLPMGSGGVPIPYAAGYSVIDPFPSSTGHTFDPVTGNHCSTSNVAGQYVVAYDVHEYRSGALVGTAHREVQLWVITCPVATIDVVGTVNDTLGNPVNAGSVELYEYGLNSAGSILVGTSPVSVGGTYSFTGLPAQQYLTRAIPDSAGYPGTAASYHSSTYYWTYADVIYGTCDSVFQADIELVPLTNLAGTGYLSGYLGDLGIIRDDGPGVPWEQVGVILERWPELGLVAYTRTDIDGHFHFSNVPDGTYRIICDHPGLPMLSFYVLTIGPGTYYGNLNYAADPNGFFTSGIPTGIASVSTPEVVLAPNPVHNGNAIIIGLRDGATPLLITDASGRVVRSEVMMVNGGTLQLPAVNLPIGVYTISIGDGAQRFKLVKD